MKAAVVFIQAVKLPMALYLDDETNTDMFAVAPKQNEIIITESFLAFVFINFWTATSLKNS